MVNTLCAEESSSQGPNLASLKGQLHLHNVEFPSAGPLMGPLYLQFLEFPSAAPCSWGLYATNISDYKSAEANSPAAGQMVATAWLKAEYIRANTSNCKLDSETQPAEAVEPAPSLEDKFNRLANAWKSVAAGPASSISRIVTHPAYLEIISLGEKMIPFILRDLQKEPNHWFVALKILARQFSPVKPQDAGNMKKMTEAWLEWGRKNGKLD